MERLSMDLSELMLGADDDLALGTLANGFDDEETWLVAPPTTASGPHRPRDENDAGEEEDLTKWLEGAVRKVDFRTRSALSRRLEKKRKRREKRERLILSKDNPLARIDETGGRTSQDGLDTDDGLSDEDEDDVYFDAADAAENIDETRSAGILYRTPKSHRASGRAASLRGAGQRRDTVVRPENAAQMNAGERLDLSELERRAREQEQELQMELVNRRERLQIISNSRPNSASSSASSSLANVVLATSRSVDFRTARAAAGAGGGSSVASSTDGGGSNSDLSRLTPTHVSRLPMPRRPVVGGRTGIPLPTPKATKTPAAEGAPRSSFRRQATAPPPAGDSALLDADGDCF